MAEAWPRWSLGGDTGGSIRCPAGLCGCVGLKPTYGRVRVWPGGLCQQSRPGRPARPGRRGTGLLALEVLAGHDPLDSTSIDLPVPRYTETIKQPLEGLRLGLVREHFGEGLDAEVERAVREAVHIYELAGAEVERLTLPHGKYAVAAYYIIAPCEASAIYRPATMASITATGPKRREGEREKERKERGRRVETDSDNPLVEMYRRSRSEGFGAEVKHRIMLGTYALSTATTTPSERP